MATVRIDAARVDAAFRNWVSRSGDFSPVFRQGILPAHRASIGREFSRKTGFGVDGRVHPWPPTLPFGSYPGGNELRRTETLFKAWMGQNSHGSARATRSRYEISVSLPYVDAIRGGSGQRFTRSPLVIKAKKLTAGTRQWTGPQRFAKWWAILFRYGVALSEEKVQETKLYPRPHGSLHPNLRGYAGRAILQFAITGRVLKAAGRDLKP